MPRTRAENQNGKITPAVFDDVLNDQDFFKDIDKAFTRIQMNKKGRGNASKIQTKGTNKWAAKAGLKEMQKTFKSIVQLHLSPVVRYLKAVGLGVTSKDITEIMEHIVAPLILKSKQVRLTKETTNLIQFQRALKKVNRSEGAKITADEAADLKVAFEQVIKSYGLEFRGHSTAVVNVIGFYKVIKRKERFSWADLRKLFSIGIPSLSMLRKIALDELASLTGLTPDRCAELRKESRKFTLYIFV